jgi:hypothetical protein
LNDFVAGSGEVKGAVTMMKRRTAMMTLSRKVDEDGI